MRVLCLGYYGEREERDISGLSDGMDKGANEVFLKEVKPEVF